MKRETLIRLVVISAVAVSVLAGAGSSALAGEPETEEKKTKKFKIVTMGADEQCEGDCPHKGKHRIVIKKAGSLEELGEECDGECEEIVIKEGGDVVKIYAAGDGQVRMMGGECEGHDCMKMKRIAIAGEGEGAAIHSLGDHPVKIDEDCEGEDCESVHHIFVGRDGAKKVVVVDGGDFKWVEEACEGENCDKVHRALMKALAGHHSAGGHGYAFHAGHAVEQEGGFLGVYLTDLTEDLRVHFGAPADQGVMVAKVGPGSGAEIAGVEVGDIVTSINGDIVDSASSLSRAVSGLEAGSAVNLGILRDGEALELSAVLGEREMPKHHAMHRMVMVCEEGDEDCDLLKEMGSAEFDCGDAEECEIKIECDSDECACTVNGETVDCDDLGLPGHP